MLYKTVGCNRSVSYPLQTRPVVVNKPPTCQPHSTPSTIPSASLWSVLLEFVGACVQLFPLRPLVGTPLDAVTHCLHNVHDRLNAPISLPSPANRANSASTRSVLILRTRVPHTDVLLPTPQCDGARPLCTPCLVRRRPDCAYDAAGDLRRTSSLKQRIRHLETQVDDLKDIITSIGSTDDKDAAAALAYQLAHANFCTTSEVARSLRTDESLKFASTLATVSEQRMKSAARGDVTGTNASEASPSSVATGDSIGFDGGPAETPAMSWMTDMAPVDPALIQYGSNDDPNEVGEQHFH